MRLRLTPRDTRFFDLFGRAGANLGAAVEQLQAFFAAPSERRADLAARMHVLENTGDDLTHEIIAQLDRSFVTPFDREDVYRLAGRLDDVVDHVDAAVDRAALYAIEEFPAGVHEQVSLLCRASALTAEAMPRLVDPRGLTDYWVEINALENEADQVHRRLLATLFSGTYEPLTVMKLKDVVDELEAAADACEHVADVVHSIAVKES
jgi:predicted phosphate transport protein (TIGR00153 family)